MQAATNPPTPSVPGLTTAEAKQWHREFGPNEIVASRLESRLREVKKVLLDPMGLMLLILAGFYALMGNQADAMVLLLAYIPVTAVDVVRKIRAHRALHALKATLKVTSKVLRDGEIKGVTIYGIVTGDVIVFKE